METKWLEDFVTLAETRSFSRAAQLRHVTQSAFSRRIQSLESWAGVNLVDRTAFPPGLTPSGQTFLPHAQELLVLLNQTRQALRLHQGGGQDVLHFAVPHTLALSYFPRWLGEVGRGFGPLRTRLVADNVHDAVIHLTEGSCDLLMVYHHDAQPLQLNPDRYDMLLLGQETLGPYSAATVQQRPLHSLAAPPETVVPYLAYAPGAYLGRLVEGVLWRQQQLPNGKQGVKLDCVYETDMAESLKTMALAGHGVAFLPQSTVEKSLAGQVPQGQPCLVPAVDAKVWSQWAVTMDIRIYREKPQLARHPKPHAQALWAFLSDTSHHA
jgi:DNA-binding transcriptional LysR family regulator